MDRYVERLQKAKTLRNHDVSTRQRKIRACMGFGKLPSLVWRLERAWVESLLWAYNK